MGYHPGHDDKPDMKRGIGALAGLAHLIVEGVGHEGFVSFASPEVLPLVGEFLAGGQPPSRRFPGRPLEFTLPQ